MNFLDQLERLKDLHSSGALTDAEFAAAKAKLLAAEAPARPSPAETHAAEELAALRREQAVLRVDQNWQAEREAYLIKGRVPTKGEALGVGAVFLIMALIPWCLGLSAPGAALAASLFALVPGLGLTWYYWYRASEYEAAEAHYSQRRSDVGRRTDR